MDTRFKARRPRAALNSASLEEMALRYVGKYATTRAKLRAYLERKLRERGWEGGKDPDPEALATRFAELGYIDDSAYAMAKSRALSSRGFGKRRLADKLRDAGVDESDSAAANAYADSEALTAALRFAERRRIGPYANQTADRMQRQKWIASMVRAGHAFAVARAIATLDPGIDPDLDQLRDLTRLIDA